MQMRPWVTLITILILGAVQFAVHAAKQPALFITFTREAAQTDHAPKQLWVAAADGSGQRRISSDGENVVTGVAFSTRARLLAWWSILRGENGRQVFELRVRPTLGGTPRTIFEDRFANYSEMDAPAFTPDGKHIVFGRSRGEHGAGDPIQDWGLWQIGVDGKHLKRLTRGFGTRGGSRIPQVSPDGKMIAFSSYEAEEASRLCLVKRNGSKVTQTRVWIHDFAWLPKSDTMVIIQAAKDDPYGGRLAVYDLRTRKVRGLTTDQTVQPAGRIAVSPDGSQAVFARGDLVLVNLKTGANRSLVPTIDLFSARICWLSDGRILYPDADPVRSDPGFFSIFCVRPDGKNRTTVLVNGELAGVFWR